MFRAQIGGRHRVVKGYATASAWADDGKPGLEELPARQVAGTGRLAGRSISGPSVHSGV